MTIIHNVSTKTTQILHACLTTIALFWLPCQAHAYAHPTTQLESSLANHTPEHLTNAIAHANQSIQLAIYTFLSTSESSSLIHQKKQTVIQALSSAKKRGVKVTILYNHFTPQSYDPIYRIHHAIEKKEQQWCQSHHIACYPSSSGFHHSHQKYIIIDHKHAYVMTGNLPWCRSHGPCAINFSYHVQTPAPIAYLVKLFASDIHNSQLQTTYTPTPIATPWLVSPVNTEQGITHFIASTQQQLDIAQPFIQQNNHIPHAILTALDHLLARHGSVHLITNTTKSQHLNHALLKLSQRYPNFSIHCMRGGPFIHAKVMVQDHKRVLLGSANWSQDALHHNREVGIFINDMGYVRTIEKTLETLFHETQPFIKNKTNHRT